MKNIFVCLFVLLSGCASPTIRTSYLEGKWDYPIRTIAIAPTGGILAEAIGIELLNYDYKIVDIAQTTNLMMRLNLEEVELSQPQNMSLLAEENIDALLLVKSVAGYDDNIQSATAKLILTRNNKAVVGIIWENASAGQQGSLADRDVRVGLSYTATQIVRALIKAFEQHRSTDEM